MTWICKGADLFEDTEKSPGLVRVILIINPLQYHCFSPMTEQKFCHGFLLASFCAEPVAIYSRSLLTNNEVYK